MLNSSVAAISGQMSSTPLVSCIVVFSAVTAVVYWMKRGKQRGIYTAPDSPMISDNLAKHGRGSAGIQLFQESNISLELEQRESKRYCRTPACSLI